MQIDSHICAENIFNFIFIIFLTRYFCCCLVMILSNTNSTISNIRLLDEESYNKTYQTIKKEHGQQIAKSWTEKTDPSKFVYEDCGIVAYLLELWRKFDFGPRRQFVDLGCGNGLLVRLLNAVGVAGFGLDARERGIWKQFREQNGTDLREAQFDPSSPESISTHLSGVDFLIGNHSDELTPWIPVIAARLRCNFFLLPCCPYDFFTKYSRRIPSAKALAAGHPKGVADQYYAYIHHICVQLGFSVEIDMLRIPSRKRKCFVGIVPPGGLGPPEMVDNVIANLLSMAQLDKSKFTPRPSKEIVRNCSKLPQDYQRDLAIRILQFLIGSAPEENIGGWRCGGPVPLPVLAQRVLTPDDRKMLAEQDKGLQTFLRNYHQLFSVEKAVISIRKWPLDSAEFLRKNGGQIRKRGCYLLGWHPDGCPLAAGVCAFTH